MAETTRSTRPFHLMAKPTGAICNLDCDYCYFLSKEMLYPGSRFRMARATLETYIRQYIDAQPTQDVTFAWQGGEPTLMGLEFFELVVRLQREHARPGQHVFNTLQTNGTKLDDAWCHFLRRNDVLVGISIDGPKDLHDVYRVDKGGSGSFDRVMDGLALLRKHGVEFNVLATVHRANEASPLEVYRFLRDDIGARFVQFIPIVERDNETGFQEGDRVTDRSVTPRGYGTFLTTIFDEWVQRDVGRVFVQMFDETLAKYIGHDGSLCVFQETCGSALALEHNGDVYSCDHFVEPDHRLGNLNELPLCTMVEGAQQVAFGHVKLDTLPEKCRSCGVRWLCHGGCPKDRIVDTGGADRRLNYLCEGYESYFTHTEDAMRFMANELAHKRPPANIMRRVASDRPAGAARW